MKYVNSLPPLAEAPKAVEIREVHHAQAVRPVREHLFPAHIVEHNPHRETTSDAQKEEKRSDEERRLLCRRVESAELLLETRSSVERRRKSRRRSDAATSVDEEV